MHGEHYLLAILDETSQARLTKWSDELTKQGFDYARYTPYHITLGERVDLNTLAHFEDVCASMPRFDVALGSIGLFGLAVLFLAPLPSERLIILEQKLFGAINDVPDGWVPHVTMRTGETEYIERAAPVLARIFEPFKARIERLELYECGDGYANLIRRFEFMPR
jgi:hypothetical protein